MINNLLNIIFNGSLNFEDTLVKIEEYIRSYNNFYDILQYIGTIPECIAHDSSEEKLWAKASDIVLSYAFKKLGLKSSVLHTRGDSADVIAESIYHNYTLVADAKSFRLSRTAKNQKDFKVVSLSNWRQDSDYAILCSPYFHYPFNQSQIYKQAIEHNVCLFSWEYLIFLLSNNIVENQYNSLANIWNFSYNYGNNVTYHNLKQCFLPIFNNFLCGFINIPINNFNTFIYNQAIIIKNRGNIEISYWQNEKNNILSYTREKAIDELIKSKKINEKIYQINTFINGLNNGF